MTQEKVTAFILLITDSDTTQDILGELRKLKEIKEARMIYGDYDIICKVELEKLSVMTAFMMDLRKRFAIKKSSTLIALEEYPIFCGPGT